MWRIVLGGSLFAVAAWVVIQAIVTTDRERVVETVDRLLQRAQEGGEEAADEIVAALDDDFRGFMDRERLVALIREYVGGRRVKSASRGDIVPVWKDGVIVVPIFRLDVETDRFAATSILTVTFVERDGVWKVVEVSRWRRS